VLRTIEWDRVYLEKARENLESAESEFASGRYNSCASRCYYACFQAAVYALARAGIRPRSTPEEWGHNFVQAEFNGQLISRRKVYPAKLRTTLAENYAVRVTADYKRDHVTENKAARALRRTGDFLGAVVDENGEIR
jgi:uncharacterized protein (UPF0332 family)